MKSEAQRIAIAEARGFYDFRVFGRRGLVARNPGSGTFWGVLNYPADLNAMHEAEKALTEAQKVAYPMELSRITKRRSWHATAAQRAEAFLRTIGKWDESAQRPQPEGGEKR